MTPVCVCVSGVGPPPSRPPTPLQTSSLTHGVPRLSAAQHSEAAVVFLAATLCFPQLLRTLVISQVEHLLCFTLIFHLETQKKARTGLFPSLLVVYIKANDTHINTSSVQPQHLTHLVKSQVALKTSSFSTVTKKMSFLPHRAIWGIIF